MNKEQEKIVKEVWKKIELSQDNKEMKKAIKEAVEKTWAEAVKDCKRNFR